MAIGTAASTYTLAGLPSAASLAAQAAPTIRDHGCKRQLSAASPFGPDSIGALNSRIDGLGSRVDALNSRVDGSAASVPAPRGRSARSRAARSRWRRPGRPCPTARISPSRPTGARSRGETGFAATGVARLSDNVFVHAGVGFGTNRGGVGGRAGVTVAW